MTKKKEQEELKEEIEGMAEELLAGELNPRQKQDEIKATLKRLEELGFPLKVAKSRVQEELPPPGDAELPGKEQQQVRIDSSLERANATLRVLYDPNLRKRHSRLAASMILPMAVNLAIAEYSHSDKEVPLKLVFLYTLLDLLTSYKGEGLKMLKEIAGVTQREETPLDWGKG